MSSKISALTTLPSVTSNDFLVLARTTDSENYKYPLQNVLASLVNIGHTSPVYLIDAVSSTNAISQRGLKSNSSILTLTIDISGSDKNILFDIDESAIDLSLCNNSTSGFLTSTDLTAATGVTPIANGGTGESSFANRSILVTQYSGDASLNATPMINSGEIVIGGASGPTIGTITAGNNMTVTNGDGSIELSSTFTTATTDIDMNGYNLDLHTGWISVDGADGGISMGSDQMYIGSAANEFYQGSTSLNVDYSIAFKGGTEQVLLVQPADDAANFNIWAGSSTGAGNDGGDLVLRGGNGNGSGDGGNILVQSGQTTGGTAGSVKLQNTLTGVTYDSLEVVNNDVIVGHGDLRISASGKGLEVPSDVAAQSSSLSENVTINEVAGRITLARESLAAESQKEFTVTNSTVSSNSLVFVSLISPGSTNENVNAIMVAQVTNIQAGSFDVVLTNVSATTATDTAIRRLNFFVIN